MSHRYEDYAGGQLPWLDRPDAAARVNQKLLKGEIDAQQAKLLGQWITRGYVTFEGLLDGRIAEAINAEIHVLTEAHKHEPIERLREHFNNAFPHSPGTREALVVPKLLKVLDLLLGKRMLPHQTLNLPVSSQQAAHSDQILMSTHPAGYMAAVWFALEDIDAECGPLVVYPGSHRYPYLSAKQVGIPAGSDQATSDAIYNRQYYAMIGERLSQAGIEPFEFIPRRGDVLIWHSNLLHGARFITRSGATRKSLIAHYYAEGVEHYSDLYGHAVTSRELRPKAV